MTNILIILLCLCVCAECFCFGGLAVLTLMDMVQKRMDEDEKETKK